MLITGQGVGGGQIAVAMAALTFDDRVLEALRQVVALPLVLRVAELVFGFLQLPLQTIRTPLLLLGLALRLLLQPRRHPAHHTITRLQRAAVSGGTGALGLPRSLFLVVDVTQAPPAQVSARLAVGRLFDLSAESSQHGAEPSLPSKEPGLQAIDGSMLKRSVQSRDSSVCYHKQV